jgi:hypothetical protein
MDKKHIYTTPTGLIKNHPKREEKIIKLTKTLIVTEYDRYDNKTGRPIKIHNKRCGWYQISDEDLKALTHNS